MKIAVVIPSYRVKKQVLSVIERIGHEVAAIYVVDDGCPEASGNHVLQNNKDARVVVLKNSVNKGVGGATVTGYKKALEDGNQVIIKLDGDGQMPPEMIPSLVSPIIYGQADYAKGNRFFNLKSLSGMPFIRLFGNSVLSFVNKAASGYWSIMDPTNGYTAIHASALQMMDMDKLDPRYFFESDMLFRLGTLNAVVSDVPMDSHYADENSGLKIRRILAEFPLKYIKRFFKRIFYNYYLRDFNVASLEMAFGLPLFTFGLSYGVYNWAYSAQHSIATPTGTIMIALLSIILGFQLLIAAVHYDLSRVPRKPLQQQLFQWAKKEQLNDANPELKKVAS